MVTALLFIVTKVITFSALRINKQRERAILGYFLIMKVFPLTIKLLVAPSAGSSEVVYCIR